MTRLLALFVAGVMVGAGCERPAAGEAAAAAPAPPAESPLVLETIHCRVYRNVDRYGVVVYVAEAIPNYEGYAGTSINFCSGIAIVPARAEGR